jgi:hypothetical protein
MELDKIQDVNEAFLAEIGKNLSDKPYLLVLAFALNPDNPDALLTFALDKRVTEQMITDLCLTLLNKLNPQRFMVLKKEMGS